LSLYKQGIKEPHNFALYEWTDVIHLRAKQTPLGRRFRVTHLPRSCQGVPEITTPMKKVPRAVISGTPCSSGVTPCESKL
jgi:hypothetical protein